MNDTEPTVAWKGAHFQVLLVPVEYRDGTVHMHEQVAAPDVVRVYPLTGRGTILLIEEYRHDVGKTVIRVPAGRVKERESAEDAAHRELREEAGVRAGSMRLLRSSQPVLKFRYRVWHFLADGLDHIGQELEDGEEIGLAEHPIADLPELVYGGAVTEDSLALSLLLIARQHAAAS